VCIAVDHAPGEEEQAGTDRRDAGVIESLGIGIAGLVSTSRSSAIAHRC
jgi:hypothetical protein